VEAAQSSVLGEGFRQRGPLFVGEGGGFVHPVVDGVTGGGVRIFDEDVFDPLKVGQPWTVDEVVHPADRNQRLKTAFLYRVEWSFCHNGIGLRGDL